MPRRARVLLVDDDAEFREIVAAGLEAADFEVYPAASYDEARVVAGSWPPDVVVLDLLGTGHARSAARQLGVPIVLASGSTHEYLLTVGKEMDAAAVLAKPYDLRTLVRLLKRHVGRPGSDTVGPRERESGTAEGVP